MKNTVAFLFLFCATLVKAQTNLPVSRTTWNSETPLGWTDWGTTATTTSSNPDLNFGNLENAGDYFEIFFNGIPAQLTFQLKADSFSGGTFSLQESQDGIYWSNIKVYTAIDVNFEIQKFNLKSKSRFVRFIYLKKENGTISIDNIEISTSLKTNIENNLVEKENVNSVKEYNTLVEN